MLLSAEALAIQKVLRGTSYGFGVAGAFSPMIEAFRPHRLDMTFRAASGKLFALALLLIAIMVAFLFSNKEQIDQIPTSAAEDGGAVSASPDQPLQELADHLLRAASRIRSQLGSYLSHAHSDREPKGALATTREVTCYQRFALTNRLSSSLSP